MDFLYLEEIVLAYAHGSQWQEASLAPEDNLLVAYKMCTDMDMNICFYEEERSMNVR